MDKDMNVFEPVILTDGNPAPTPEGYDLPTQPIVSDDSETIID